MGWKNVKRHYRIGHFVQVTDKGICIGSPYIHNLIVIGMDGAIKKRASSTCNDELVRYQREMDADLAKLKDLVESEDEFSESITVYTFDGGEIIEKLCEEPGWPNVTHDGDMMYENTFSTDKSKVIRWAKNNAALAIKEWNRHVNEAESRLLKTNIRLKKAISDLRKLNKEFPM